MIAIVFFQHHYKGGLAMLPVERLARIKEIVLEKENVKIAELSEELKVSEMTIHRDVKQLVDEGFVVKTFGGISLAQTSTNQQVTQNSSCVLCHRPINDRFAYQLHLANNRTERACCSHCGIIRQLQLADQVVQAITYDFFTGTTMGANIAYFVVNPSVQITCCQPQVLAFDSKDNAEKFVKGFGGDAYNLEQTLEEISKHMNV